MTSQKSISLKSFPTDLIHIFPACAQSMSKKVRKKRQAQRSLFELFKILDRGCFSLFNVTGGLKPVANDNLQRSVTRICTRLPAWVKKWILTFIMNTTFSSALNAQLLKTEYKDVREIHKGYMNITFQKRISIFIAPYPRFFLSLTSCISSVFDTSQ